MRCLQPADRRVAVCDHLLLACADDQLQHPAHRRERIGDADAAQPEEAGLALGECRYRRARGRQQGRTVDVGEIGPVVGLAKPIGPVLRAAADHHLMADRAGIETRAHAGLTGDRLGLAGLEAGCAQRIARCVEDRRARIFPLVVAEFVAADRTEHGDIVAQIVFRTGQSGQAARPRVVEWLRQIDARIGCVRKGYAGHRRIAALRRLHPVVLGDDVRGPAESLSVIVYAKRAEAVARGLPVDGGVAAVDSSVEANAPLLLFAVAAREVELRSESSIRDVAGGQAREVFRCPLGHDIDRAADAPLRGHAVEEGSRSLEQLDTLERRRVDAIGRHQTVEPVQGDFAVLDPETADGQRIVAVAAADRCAHRRIGIRQHFRDAGRLLIADRLLRVARLAVRRVHIVLVAEQAELPAARDLAADIGHRQRRLLRTGGRCGRWCRRVLTPARLMRCRRARRPRR